MVLSFPQFVNPCNLFRPILRFPFASIAKAVINSKFLNDVVFRYFNELDKLELLYFCSIIFETPFEDSLFKVLIIIAPPIAPSP